MKVRVSTPARRSLGPMKVSGTKFVTLRATVVCRKAIRDVGWRIREATPDQ